MRMVTNNAAKLALRFLNSNMLAALLLSRGICSLPILAGQINYIIFSASYYVKNNLNQTQGAWAYCKLLGTSIQIVTTRYTLNRTLNEQLALLLPD